MNKRAGPPDIGNAAKGAWFEAQVKSILEAQWGLLLRSGVALPIGDPPKARRFDLIGEDGQTVVECKFIALTQSGNLPSPKRVECNKAVFYLNRLQAVVYRYLALPMVRPRGYESTARYYWRTSRRLLGPVQVLEVDVDVGIATVVGSDPKLPRRTVARTTRPPTVGQSARGRVVRVRRVTYWVYENWAQKRARVHRADCVHCNAGQGTRGGSSGHMVRWHGPFRDRVEAFHRAARTGHLDTQGCERCDP